jgi:hypothetical protein
VKKEQALEHVRQANPVPTGSTRPSAFLSSTALLELIYERSGDMQTQDKPVTEQRPIPMPSAPPKPRRWLVPALTAAAAVLAAFIIVLAVLDDGSPDVADFSEDPTLVGEALTAAYNSGDADIYLSLFATDAEVTFNSLPGSLEVMRAEYEDWDRIMNRSYEWSNCDDTISRVEGRVRCLAAITDPIWISPLLSGPWPAIINIDTADGKITRYDYRDMNTPNVVPLTEFRTWTREAHPEEAAVMWQSGTLPYPITSEESAQLHVDLGEEYVAQLDTGG